MQHASGTPRIEACQTAASDAGGIMPRVGDASSATSPGTPIAGGELRHMRRRWRLHLALQSLPSCCESATRGRQAHRVPAATVTAAAPRAPPALGVIRMRAIVSAWRHCHVGRAGHGRLAPPPMAPLGRSAETPNRTSDQAAPRWGCGVVAVDGGTRRETVRPRFVADRHRHGSQQGHLRRGDRRFGQAGRPAQGDPAGWPGPSVSATSRCGTEPRSPPAGHGTLGASPWRRSTPSWS
jgi:hypothetical protein